MLQIKEGKTIFMYVKESCLKDEKASQPEVWGKEKH